ncbi:MAG: FHA domain-containing protein [Planctomycetes bacterium]|nr:FHA domain-containing protein [Planctomycetota bacterium]
MNPFLEACGANGPLDLLIAGAAERELQRFRLLQPFAVIGNGASCDVILDDDEICHRHSYFQILDGEIFCVDLACQMTMHWPEGPRAAGWFPSADCLRLGKQRLRLLDRNPSHATAPKLDPMAAGSLENPWLAVEFLNGRASQGRWTMNRRLALIGTAPHCKLRLHHSEVAPVHGSLVCTPASAWVVDLLGPGGITLNGKQVRMARLEDGDLLNVAGFVMRVHGRAASSSNASTYSNRDAIAVAELSPWPASGSNSSSPLAPMTTASSLGPLHPGQALLQSILLPLVQQFSAMQNQMFEQFRQATAMMFQMFGTLQKDQMDFIRQEWKQIQERQQKQAPQPEVQHAEVPSTATMEVNETSAVNRQDAGSTATELITQPATDATEIPEFPKNGEVPGPEIHEWLCQRMAELQKDGQSRLHKILGFLSRK